MRLHTHRGTTLNCLVRCWGASGEPGEAPELRITILSIRIKDTRKQAELLSRKAAAGTAHGMPERSCWSHWFSVYQVSPSRLVSAQDTLHSMYSYISHSSYESATIHGKVNRVHSLCVQGHLHPYLYTLIWACTWPTHPLQTYSSCMHVHVYPIFTMLTWPCMLLILNLGVTTPLSNLCLQKYLCYIAQQ